MPRGSGRRKICEQCGQPFKHANNLQKLCQRCMRPQGELAEHYPTHPPDVLDAVLSISGGKSPTAEQEAAIDEWIKTEWRRYRLQHQVGAEPCEVHQFAVLDDVT